jgi:hypothetical protein
MPHFKLTPLGEIAYRHGAMTSVKWVQDNWKDVVKAADEDSEWELLLNERIECLTEMRDRFYELMNHLHGAPMSPPPKQDKETVVLLKGRLGVAYEALRLIGVLAQPGSLTAELVKTGLLDLQPAQKVTDQ